MSVDGMNSMSLLLTHNGGCNTTPSLMAVVSHSNVMERVTQSPTTNLASECLDVTRTSPKVWKILLSNQIAN